MTLVPGRGLSSRASIIPAP